MLYTVSSGDEPGCLIELYDFVTTLGFEPIVIGKGKNNPLNTAATPDMVAESARKSDKDPFQVASYVDGTKTMFEMTCAANATGCLPMQRGMVGPEATLETVSRHLRPGGGRRHHPVPRRGGLRAGVEHVRRGLRHVRVQRPAAVRRPGIPEGAGTRPGKYFTFFRPYHLWFIEAPISVAHAPICTAEQWLVPLDRARRRRDDHRQARSAPRRAAGRFRRLHVLRYDGDAPVAARACNALPVGLAPGAQVLRPCRGRRGHHLGRRGPGRDQHVVRLRRQQDALDVSGSSTRRGASASVSARSTENRTRPMLQPGVLNCRRLFNEEDNPGDDRRHA